MFSLTNIVININAVLRMHRQLNLYEFQKSEWMIFKSGKKTRKKTYNSNNNGHCSIPSYLFKMHVTDFPDCTFCDQGVGTLDQPTINISSLLSFN